MQKIESQPIQQPLIPKVTLDPFPTAAFFALYNVLNEKDRFGIHKHVIFQQPSSVYEVPYFGPVDSQLVSRNYYRSSREDSSDFVIAIMESISAYIKYKSFRKLLPDLKTGLVRYTKSYGVISDIATTTFKLAIDRTEEAIKCGDNYTDFCNKYSEEIPRELLNSEKFYGHWEESEIDHVVNGICLAIHKYERNKNCDAEIKSTSQYLAIKQGQSYSILESKQIILHDKKRVTWTEKKMS